MNRRTGSRGVGPTGAVESQRCVSRVSEDQRVPKGLWGKLPAGAQQSSTRRTLGGRRKWAAAAKTAEIAGILGGRRRRRLGHHEQMIGRRVAAEVEGAGVREAPQTFCAVTSWAAVDELLMLDPSTDIRRPNASTSLKPPGQSIATILSPSHSSPQCLYPLPSLLIHPPSRIAASPHHVGLPLAAQGRGHRGRLRLG